jgi:ABC-type sugar transport system ATPase subunit
MLRVENLNKRFGKNSGLFDLSLAVEKDENLVLLGPSGSGKTTLLRLIAGVEPLDSGQIMINGQNVSNLPAHLRNIAYLPQKPALYPEMKVAELIKSVAHKEGCTYENALKFLNLGHLVDRYSSELSSGEKQRVSLARTVVRNAKIWLLDEPFATLDPPFREEFRQTLLLLVEASGATIIIVTHDPIDAWALGRRVGVLVHGRLESFGVPRELADQPNNRFVALSLGRYCLLDGFVRRLGETSRGESAIDRL